MAGPQISIDGKANDEVNETGVTEAYRINSHKIKGVYRFNLTGKLKKKVKLDIKTNYLWDTKGDWSMQLRLSKQGSAKKTKVTIRSKKSIRRQSYYISIRKYLAKPMTKNMIL